MRTSVEADVRDEEPSELGRPDRAAGVPRRPELRGCHRRDRRVERRQRGHRWPSVLWAAQRGALALALVLHVQACPQRIVVILRWILPIGHC